MKKYKNYLNENNIESIISDCDLKRFKEKIKNIDVKDVYLLDVVEQCIMRNNQRKKAIEMFKILLKLGCSPNQYYAKEYLPFFLLKRHEIELFELLLDYNIDVNATEINRNETLLIYLIQSVIVDQYFEYDTKIKLIKKIVSNKNIEINKQGNFGNTALIKACVLKDMKIVNILLKHNADVTIKNHHKENALFCALPSIKILNKLLNKLNNYNILNEQNTNGDTLLIDISKLFINEKSKKELLYSILKYDEIDWTIINHTNKDFLNYLNNNIDYYTLKSIKKDFPEKYKNYLRIKEMNKFNI